MKLLAKEWKLCMHPMGFIMPLTAALVLVPGYPYGVICFYMCLGIFFICLTARENHDASFTLSLPVTRGDAVRARLAFCVLLEVWTVVLSCVFIVIKKALGGGANPAGLDAGAALIGEEFIIFAIFNAVFFPCYYKDIRKPGKAFAIAAVPVFLWIVLEIAACYAVPFVRDALDAPDPEHMKEKILFAAAGFIIFAAATSLGGKTAEKTFGKLDLDL